MDEKKAVIEETPSLHFAPGQDFHYSNTNFILLGMIIEQITGHPVEYEFQQRIFTPLGVTHSLLPPRSSVEIPTPYAHGYMFNTPAISNDEINESTQKLADVTPWNPSWGWMAGSAISTLHDLEIWAKALASSVGADLSAFRAYSQTKWLKSEDHSLRTMKARRGMESGTESFANVAVGKQVDDDNDRDDDVGDQRGCTEMVGEPA